jgi:tyrosyl-tRNA synthetase
MPCSTSSIGRFLDEPVPMLGNVSPRAAARSARGRRNVAAWLKHVENQSRNALNPNDPMATYNFTWLWQELRLEQLRN